jgi:hypothetical protein
MSILKAFPAKNRDLPGIPAPGFRLFCHRENGYVIDTMHVI